MIKVGLTGSIGMGKSTTASMFRDAGVPVYDADATVHQLYEGEAVAPVGEHFPDAVQGKKIDRKILSGLVLNNPEKLKLLESIVHPLVHRKERDFIAEAEKTGAKFVILDIPLLFETGGAKRVDKIVVVTAPAHVQRERVLSRPEMTEEKFEAILARQVPDAEKRDRADFIIDTSRGFDDAQKQVVQIIEKLNNIAVNWQDETRQ